MTIEEIRLLAVAFAQREWKAGSIERSDSLTEFIDEDIKRASESVPSYVELSDPVIRENCIIELQPGLYYLTESASTSGYIFTQEPLKASWVTQSQADQYILPRIQKTFPGARVITIKVKYELNE